MRYRSNIKNVAIAWFSALAFAGWVQAQDCEFSLGPDTTLCDGQNICRTIIESHWGSLTFANRAGGGAAFSIQLPCTP